MAKRASPDEAIDPVRSRLAAAASAPPRPKTVVGSEGLVEPSTPTRKQAVAVEEQRPLRGSSRRGGKPRILTVNRKIMVTEQEALQIEEATGVITASFGSKVTYSQVSRALWSILAGADDAIRAGARRAPNLRVPSKGDHVGMAEYEEALADFLATALKRS